LLGFFAVLVLILTLWAVREAYRNSPVRQVEKELQRLKQAGEPTTLADILPPVPPQKDGTVFYQLAFAQLDAANRKFPKQVWDSVYEFISTRPTKPFSLADVRKVLQAAQPALKTLRKAINYPHMRLTNWNVENPFGVMFPHFSKFREFARLLVAEGKMRKMGGDIDGAVESIMTALKLARRMGDEPSILAGFLFQGSVQSIALGGLRQILSDADASPQTYRALMAELRGWDIDRDLLRSLQSERVFAIAVCEWMQKKASRKEIQELFIEVDGSLNLAIWLMGLMGKSDWIASNELEVLKCFNEVIGVARKGVPYDWKALQRLDERVEREVVRPSWRFTLGGMEVIWNEKAIARMLVLTYASLFSKAATFHALQRVAQTAVALRLYRRERGHYPERLDELVPKYLPSVPVDPFDGKPLRYKRLGRGFKVWSIGRNMKDEGGVEKRPLWVEGDIVWEAVK